MKFRYLSVIFVAFLIVETGCALKRPTIAHTHIGHALTGWIDTPGKEGLFVVAEKKARAAMEAAKSAASESKDMARIKQHVKDVITATNPPQPSSEGSAIVYGVKQALTGAIGHMTYAATSDDATANVRKFAPRFESDAGAVLDRCDLITALSQDVVNSRSVEETRLLTGEVYKLTRSNLFGADVDGDGKVGANPAEFGLKQLRQETEAMLAREDPPYATVSRWYLFNLIRLPDGRWLWRTDFRDQDDPYAGGGGGY